MEVLLREALARRASEQAAKTMWYFIHLRAAWRKIPRVKMKFINNGKMEVTKMNSLKTLKRKGDGGARPIFKNRGTPGASQWVGSDEYCLKKFANVFKLVDVYHLLQKQRYTLGTLRSSKIPRPLQGRQTRREELHRFLVLRAQRVIGPELLWIKSTPIPQDARRSINATHIGRNAGEAQVFHQ